MGYHFVEWVGESVDVDDPNDSDLVLNQVIRNMSLTAVFALDATEYTSQDGLVSLVVPVGTEALNEQRKPLEYVGFDVAQTPPLPDRVEVVGRAYELEPSGATFDSPVSLVWNYDSAQVPEQVDEEYLTIAYYNQDTGQWIELPSEVDPEKGTIAADVAHLSLFAVLAHLPLPPPLGAAFTTPGTDPIPVVFTVSVDGVGDHTIEVNGLSDSLAVTTETEAPLPPSISGPRAASPGINWNVIAPIIVGVFLAIFIPIRMRSRRGPLDW
jgi:hypothetical protein